MQERLNSLREMMPEFAEATDMDRLAAMADASGIYSFGERTQIEQVWPVDTPAPTRARFQTLKRAKGTPSVLLLVRVEHSWEVPAYLEFGGWNDCPAPELHVAVLREWRNNYRAAPACITGDVLECVVIKRPQTEAEAMKLAAEQWIFCEDIVGDGNLEISDLVFLVGLGNPAYKRLDLDSSGLQRRAKNRKKSSTIPPKPTLNLHLPDPIIEGCSFPHCAHLLL
jgi:hypothetical protein